MNVFLSREPRDVDTALLLENAIVCDFGNGIAGTDGEQVFINTEDKLNELLPDYNEDMLKWLLWHEEYHKLLKHHNRYFKYCSELAECDRTEETLNLTKEEVNIIMDILVHDTLSKLFPELVDTAIKNCAQMRNRNSLKYTFKTYTLEEMLEEYSKSKEDSEDGKGTKDTIEEETEDSKSKSKGTKEEDGESEGEDSESKPADKKEEEPADTDSPAKEKPKKKDEITEGEKHEERELDNAEHEKTDWSKLENIDTEKEFLTDEDSYYIKRAVDRLKRRKINVAVLTKTLSGLVCDKKERTYAVPSRISVAPGVILKGRKPTKTSLYLCFDATGSMCSELALFKEIISNSVPQAMSTPCDWFCNEYYHYTFKEMYNEGSAFGGYNDDGDRTIKLCYEAEQKGYSVIGVTDGGGGLSHNWGRELAEKLQRTIIVTQSASFEMELQRINPKIQVIYLGD